MDILPTKSHNTKALLTTAYLMYFNEMHFILFKCTSSFTAESYTQHHFYFQVKDEIKFDDYS